MPALIARRLGNALLVLVVSTMVVFVIVSLSGDPLETLRDQNPGISDRVLALEASRLGLDQPLPVRYLSWLTGVLSGDFGPSVIRNQDIGADLLPRVLVSLRLVLVAIVIAFVLALVLGTAAALWQNRPLDHLVTTSAFILIALPSFWLAVLLKQAGIAANTGTGLQIFFTIGDASVPLPEAFGPRILDLAGHLILPTIVLVLIHFASWSRYQRTAVIEALGSEHVRFAVLRGLSRGRIVRAHVVRPALIPIVTVVALDLPALLSGVIITETVFQWRGMGVFLLQSIANRDTNAVLAWLLIAAVAVVVFNLLADLAYAVIDPRIRHER
jgi:peptide/nickel transport system permease protein